MSTGISIDHWLQGHPLVQDLVALKETAWFNPAVQPADIALSDVGLTWEDVQGASARLTRFAPYIRRIFPQTEEAGGIIESPIQLVPRLQEALGERYGLPLPGQLWLKLDSHLPISGSIKARGGIYEVLKHAEDLALEHGLLKESDDYSVLAEPRFREFFSKYSITVGSTGNLGLSIGIMSAKMGFRVTVHMSSDAKE